MPPSCETLLQIEHKLLEELRSVSFTSPVEFVYNPLEYAADVHEKFYRTFMKQESLKIMFLGMNPGPWGMMQNGIPFGETAVVKNWFRINGRIGKPIKQHPLRQIEGLACHRSEISGKRFWGLFQKLCGKPDNFFRHSFVYNFCPFGFLSRTCQNITPVELKREERKILLEICGKFLLQVVKELNVEIIVGVGRFAERQTVMWLKKLRITNIRVVWIPHPSPRSIQKMTDEITVKWMKVALGRAQEALERGEVPVGCLFIFNDQCLAVGSNEVNETKNATRHAEMTCVDSVLDWCQKQNRDYSQVFPQIDVIVTVEPCIMCASALHQLNVRRIIYGAANSRFGGCSSVLNVSQVHNTSGVTVIGGLFAEDAVALLKQFYDGTNPNAPTPKVKKRKSEP